MHEEPDIYAAPAEDEEQGVNHVERRYLLRLQRMLGNFDKARRDMTRGKWILYIGGILLFVLGMKIGSEVELLPAFTLVVAGSLLGMALIYAGGARVIIVLLRVIDGKQVERLLNQSDQVDTRQIESKPHTLPRQSTGEHT